MVTDNLFGSSLFPLTENHSEIANEVHNKESQFQELTSQFWIDVCTNPSLLDSLLLSNLINQLKQTIRKFNSLTPCVSSAIIGLFSLLNSFYRIKAKEGQLIYKNLVFLLFENYNDISIREFILSHFYNFFIVHQSAPISFLIEPYINQIKVTKNINVIDFTFLAYIIHHPRFTTENAIKIVEFCLNISIDNLIYSRSANLILNILFSTRLLHKANEATQIIEKYLYDFINNVFHLYQVNLNKGIIDNTILEMPYDIMIENYGNVNNKIHEMVASLNEEFRKREGKYANSLLAFLWFYEDHDDIILRLEEKYYKESIINYQNNNTNIELNKNKKIIISVKGNIGNCLRKQAEKTISSIKSEQQKKELLKKEEEKKKKRSKVKIEKILRKELVQKGLSLGIDVNSISSVCEISNMTNLSNQNKTLIFDEGTIIKEKYNNNNITSIIRPTSKMKLTTLIDFNQNTFLIKPSEEENREEKAIKGYNQKYKQKIKMLCKSLSNEKGVITKATIIKFFRQKNITNNEFTLDELSLCIRNCFVMNLNELTHSQFKCLLISMGYLIMSKINYNYTISECYCHFLNRIIPNLNYHNDYYEKYKPILKYIKHYIDKQSIDVINIPPGFKIVKQIDVVYKHKIPSLMKKHFTESYIICIDIINSLIQKIIGSEFLESFVKIKQIDDIEIDLGEIKKWTNEMMIAYSKLPKEYEKIGIEVADCLEERLRELCKGRDKMGNIIIPPIKKEKIETNILENELKKKKEEIRIKRQNEIKEMVEKYKKEKEEKQKKELEEKETKEMEKKKQFHEMIIESKKKNKKVLEELSLLKKKKEEEKLQQIKLKQEKDNELKMKKKEEKALFFKKQNQKLKEQFLLLKKEKEETLKKRTNSNPKIPIVHTDYLEKDKDYIEFDKKLIQIFNDIITNNKEISFLFLKFEEHLKLLFDIYSKIGQKSLTFNNNREQVLYLNEFKELLVNFTVLNILISPDQMNFTFKRIARKNENKGDTLFITYDDFKISLLFLIIYSKLSDKGTKITQEEVNSINCDNVNQFFEYLGFKIPFEKREIENYINVRRGMNAKEFLELQKKMKKEKLYLFKSFNQKTKSMSRPHSQIKHRVNSIQKTQQDKTIDVLTNIKIIQPDTNNETKVSKDNSLIKCLNKEIEEMENNENREHKNKYINELNSNQGIQLKNNKLKETKESNSISFKNSKNKKRKTSSKSSKESNKTFSRPSSSNSKSSNQRKVSKNNNGIKQIDSKDNNSIQILNANGKEETWNIK